MGEVAVPGVDEHSGVVVEEPSVPDLERFGEQVGSAGQPSDGARRGGQHHEGMRVARLLVRLTCGVDAGQPTAARAIPQPAGQTSQRLRGKIGIPGATQ